MTREFEELSNAFGWEDEDFRTLNEAAINAAFCDAATKDTLLKRISDI